MMIGFFAPGYCADSADRVAIPVVDPHGGCLGWARFRSFRKAGQVTFSGTRVLGRTPEPRIRQATNNPASM